MITLTPEPSTGSIAIQLTGHNGDRGFTLTRSDRNGTAPVRLVDGQEPIEGNLTVRDYEPALSGTVTYTATSLGALLPDETVDDLVDVADTRLDIAPGRDQLTVVALPQLNAQPRLIDAFTARRESRSTIHQVIGRHAPIVTVGPLGSRTGLVSFTAMALAEAEAVVTVLEQPTVLQLRFAASTQTRYPAATDLYFAVTELSLQPDSVDADPPLWGVDLQYQEVQRPVTPLQGALGWNYSSLLSTYSTYADLKTAIRTYADLATGMGGPEHPYV